MSIAGRESGFKQGFENIIIKIEDGGKTMVFGWLKKKDPVCGMKQEPGKGTEKHGHWFCSANCIKEYEQNEKKREKGCCSPGN